MKAKLALIAMSALLLSACGDNDNNMVMPEPPDINTNQTAAKTNLKDKQALIMRSFYSSLVLPCRTN
ncbi:hypothetical protein SIO17_01125 [Pseudoalteromonas piscicida]|uniref:Lipoprotein n=1 Tax=Pseudoalteromonas piscicida TaxID=43662 RepID=A0ABM6N9N2_PSEO7|nr:hypothetical protein [Pseudoalteromonas piscicida]ATD05583.1 hypothetical protein PPIS_a0248 [Pseudoalteromonas piscicida]WPU32372.1 hypothetical protein SIO17_01125 [Pseudoalteromonas piscicida]